MWPRLIGVIVAWTWLLCPLALSVAEPPRPVAKPAVAKRLPYYDDLSNADRKVALHAFDLLWDATASGQWEPVREQLKLLWASRIVAGPWEPQPVACLAYCSLFAEHVPAPRSLEGTDTQLREFQRWLLANPILTRRLLFALNEADRPDGALSVLYTLAHRHPSAVAAYPDLAVAIAIVFDDRSVPPEPCCTTFDWLIQGRGRLAYDPAQLPHEVARYLVDVSVSPAERTWAYDRYKGEWDLDDVYRDVEYDRDALTGRRPKKITGQHYDLFTIHAFGGTCGDQAFYASQVGRILGFPVAGIHHGGLGLLGHAWCLQLVPQRGGLVWREVGGQGFGWVTDPATGRPGSDQTLSFAMVSLQQDSMVRDTAAALAQTALRIPGWVRADLPAGPGELVRLTKPATEPANEGAVAPYYRSERTLDPVPVLQAALRLDPYNPVVWAAVESLGTGGSLSPGVLADFMAQLEGLAGRQFPDVLHFAVVNLSSHLPPDVAIRFLEAAWKNLNRAQVERAPERVGDLLLRVAALHAQAGHVAEALRWYETSMTATPEYPPNVLEAFRRALPLAEQTGDVPRFVRACEALFEKDEDPPFGLDVGRILDGSGMSQRAVVWLRYVFDRTKRDTPGRYASLRLGVDILQRVGQYGQAAQWSAELYDLTLHPGDGQKLAELLAALGRDAEARSVWERVQQIEYRRQQAVAAEAADRARRD